MCRAFADTGRGAGYERRATVGGPQALLRGAVLSAMVLLTACGSEPTKPEEKPSVIAPATAAVTTSPVTSPTVEAEPSKPQAKSAARSKTAIADAANEAAPVEAPVPPEAQQQFDNALATMNSGNLGSAEQSFRSLASAYPTYAGPLLNLGILQAKAGKLDESQKTLNEAIARNGNSAAAFNQLGIVYRRLGRFKEADEAYQQSLRVDPNYALAWLNLGVLCDLYLQQPQRALEAYERYLELAASPDAKVNSWVTELKTRLGNQERSARSEP